jgi:hypothetical protein
MEDSVIADRRAGLCHTSIEDVIGISKGKYLISPKKKNILEQRKLY